MIILAPNFNGPARWFPSHLDGLTELACCAIAMGPGRREYSDQRRKEIVLCATKKWKIPSESASCAPISWRLVARRGATEVCLPHERAPIYLPPCRPCGQQTSIVRWRRAAEHGASQCRPAIASRCTLSCRSLLRSYYTVRFLKFHLLKAIVVARHA